MLSQIEPPLCPTPQQLPVSIRVKGGQPVVVFEAATLWPPIPFPLSCPARACSSQRPHARSLPLPAVSSPTVGVLHCPRVRVLRNIRQMKEGAHDHTSGDHRVALPAAPCAQRLNAGPSVPVRRSGAGHSQVSAFRRKLVKLPWPRERRCVSRWRSSVPRRPHGGRNQLCSPALPEHGYPRPLALARTLPA